jgi:glycosyltransferase involved in cell wall biosynthesis
VLSTSVIVSTSNSASYLEKVLSGLAAQSELPAEVIVADDGSSDATAAVIAAANERKLFPIFHVWQEKDGFRKCRILNRAIDRANGDYLVFMDGDCVPRRDFMAVHQRRAVRGRFLSGGVFRLPRPLSDSIAAGDIAEGHLFERRWLRKHGVRVSVASKIGAAPQIAYLLSKVTPTRATFNGHNSSAWRDDVVRINGFDERMVYGGLDRELGERLENAGVRGLGVRYEAVCVHLDHDRGYVDDAGWKANHSLRAETRRQKSTWTPFGIVREAAFGRP